MTPVVIVMMLMLEMKVMMAIGTVAQVLVISMVGLDSGQDE